MDKGALGLDRESLASRGRLASRRRRNGRSLALAVLERLEPALAPPSLKIRPGLYPEIVGGLLIEVIQARPDDEGMGPFDGE